MRKIKPKFVAFQAVPSPTDKQSAWLFGLDKLGQIWCIDDDYTWHKVDERKDNVED